MRCLLTITLFCVPKDDHMTCTLRWNECTAHQQPLCRRLSHSHSGASSAGAQDLPSCAPGAWRSAVLSVLGQCGWMCGPRLAIFWLFLKYYCITSGIKCWWWQWDFIPFTGQLAFDFQCIVLSSLILESLSWIGFLVLNSIAFGFLLWNSYYWVLSILDIFCSLFNPLDFYFTF